MEAMEAIDDFYSNLHMPLALCLCIFGIIGHIIAIGVLTRMLNPTNLLLISMSCSQLLLCINFLYSTLYKYGSDQLCLSILWSFELTSSLLISVNLSVIVEMCGVFHVVAISIIRYITLSKLSKTTSAQPWFTYSKCWKSLGIIYSSVLFICIPLYFHSQVVEAVEDESCISRYPYLSGRINYRLSFAQNELLQIANFWLFGSICKIIPCLILCVMSVLLIGSLTRIREIASRFASVSRDRQHHRTTKIILVIMSLFICVELPQGIIAMIQGITIIPYQDFIGDLFEMLTLLTSCLIFALFCSMNSTLRTAFYEKICFLRFIWHRSQSVVKSDKMKHDFLETSSVKETRSLVEWSTQKTDL
uniref:G-protein coupled receptors family 1 profile domain-containing protein n=1 Tax=Panagrolaimus sp. PS1159 TaxID=55785 RepID=A0AC35FDS6_9BILA